MTVCRAFVNWNGHRLNTSTGELVGTCSSHTNTVRVFCSELAFWLVQLIDEIESVSQNAISWVQCAERVREIGTRGQAAGDYPCLASMCAKSTTSRRFDMDSLRKVFRRSTASGV